MYLKSANAIFKKQFPVLLMCLVKPEKKIHLIYNR